MSKDAKNVPALRFKGYSDAWEKRKLGEVADIVGGGTPSTSRPEYWNGEIDWYAPAEIGTQRYVYKSRRQITELGLEKSSAVMLPANKTILFTSRAGIGNAAILTSPATTNQGFQSMIVNSNTDTYFLYSKIPDIKHKAIRVAAGSTFLEISGKSLSKIPIKLPIFEEQVKIGRLFLKIDNLIAATQHKIDALEQAKKVLLQRLFDQSWRFKDYSDPWEKRKLGELVEIQNGYAFESKYFTEAPTKFVVVTPGSVLIGGGFRFGSGHFYDLNGPVPRDFVFKPGDLFLTLTDLTPSARLLGYSAFVPHDDNVYLHNQRLGKIESIGSSLSFIYYLTSTPSFHNAIVRGASGTTVKHSSKAKVLSYQSEIPFLSEQHQISSFLKKFDDLIAATQSRLSSLELLKKFLLQNLFI
ncbi:restriction endonuclease subunit S [Lacticaseibacillus paracasei]|uniref:restriction endonuclease subunit S n=1 Tax=Lacticaseibacillus paracasei TaxID=1597 RepID=UPI000F0BCC24|nr:restriction endonuclease subunit S [Lacticaseibacillus paracasei]RNE02083.1 EcoKI restriction-modification system protein HsdS [Lacticaseibacillus paracasei]